MSIEKHIIDIAVKAAPWIAPIPTVWAVSKSAYSLLGWPVVVAAAAGIAIEAGNVSSIYTALELYTYNQDKRQSDPTAPTWIAISMAAVTFAASFLLAVFVEVFPAIAVWSAAVFPLLSLSGAIILALRGDHARRLAKIEDDKAERRKERAEKSRKAAESVEALPESAPEQPESTESAQPAERRRAAWPDLTAEDKIALAGKSPAEILELFDLSDRSARTWSNRLKIEGNGKVHDNTL